MEAWGDLSLVVALGLGALVAAVAVGQFVRPSTLPRSKRSRRARRQLRTYVSMSGRRREVSDVDGSGFYGRRLEEDAR